MSQAKETQRAYHPVPDLLRESHGKAPQEDKGYVARVPEEDVASLFPKAWLRKEVENFPEVSETEVVRHFTRLSQLNFSIDAGFYPLGSCTMKYNPKINEKVAALPGFSSLHPFTPEKFSQGALEIMHELQEALIAISGLKACSVHPAAGAHGELVGVKMISAYHRRQRGKPRNTIIIPDSAHGTNPASAALSGVEG